MPSSCCFWLCLQLAAQRIFCSLGQSHHKAGTESVQKGFPETSDCNTSCHGWRSRCDDRSCWGGGGGDTCSPCRQGHLRVIWSCQRQGEVSEPSQEWVKPSFQSKAVITQEGMTVVAISGARKKSLWGIRGWTEVSMNSNETEKDGTVTSWSEMQASDWQLPYSAAVTAAAVHL